MGVGCSGEGIACFGIGTTGVGIVCLGVGCSGGGIVCLGVGAAGVGTVCLGDGRDALASSLLAAFGGAAWAGLGEGVTAALLLCRATTRKGNTLGAGGWSRSPRALTTCIRHQRHPQLDASWG